jgi:predicted permease
MGALWAALWEWKEGWTADSLLLDTRYAVRTLARSPGFTITAVFMLALSIGANTALFSVLEAALLAKPPFPEPDRIVVIDQLFGPPEGGMLTSRWSYPRYRALQDEVESVEQLAGYNLRTMTLTGIGAPTVIGVETVSPSLFPLLGIQAVRGRVFGPDEVDRGAANMVALVSHSFWRSQLGASPNVIGSTITLDRLSLQVLGVLPQGFDGITGGAEVWVPFSALREIEDPTLLEDPWNQHFNLVGRLAPGVTLGTAREQVRAFGSTVMERFPPPVGASQMTSSADVVPYMEARMDPGARTSVLALFGAVLLVLLIATANLAGLLLARGTSRQRETAVRASLGAGRSRLLRQLLTESLVLSLAGGVLGVAAAWFGVNMLGTWMADTIGTGGGRGLQYLDPDSLAINGRVLLFAALVTGGVGIGFGLLPAWQAARTDPSATLRGGQSGAGAAGPAETSARRNGLIVIQVAVALVLLAGASLMMQSMANMQRADRGYDAERLLTAIYTLAPSDVQAGVDPGTFHTAFLDRVRELPGVTGATLGEVPMGGPTQRTIVMGSDGRPDLTPATHTWVRVQPVADGHFGVLGAGLLEGRDIERSDDGDSENVVILNESSVAELFPDGNPLGRRIRLPFPGYLEIGATVVGVAADQQLGPPGSPVERQVFVSVRQAPQLATGLLIRTAVEPSVLVPAVRATFAELSATSALTSIMSMEDRTATVTARPRVVTMLLGILSALSIVLVAAGLYGIIAFTVARRTQELGLRASLGADRASLAALVLRQGMGVTLTGIVLGVIGASWATRFLQGLLFGTDGLNALSLMGVSAALFAVACIAAYLPARRAMRIDPMVALRPD